MAIHIRGLLSAVVLTAGRSPYGPPSLFLQYNGKLSLVLFSLYMGSHCTPLLQIVFAVTVARTSIPEPHSFVHQCVTATL